MKINNIKFGTISVWKNKKKGFTWKRNNNQCEREKCLSDRRGTGQATAISSRTKSHIFVYLFVLFFFSYDIFYTYETNCNFNFLLFVNQKILHLDKERKISFSFLFLLLFFCVNFIFYKCNYYNTERISLLSQTNKTNRKKKKKKKKQQKHKKKHHSSSIWINWRQRAIFFRLCITFFFSLVRCFMGKFIGIAERTDS